MGFHAQFYIISCTQHLSVVLSRYELQNGNSHSLCPTGRCPTALTVISLKMWRKLLLHFIATLFLMKCHEWDSPLDISLGVKFHPRCRYVACSSFKGAFPLSGTSSSRMRTDAAHLSSGSTPAAAGQSPSRRRPITCQPHAPNSDAETTRRVRFLLVGGGVLRHPGDPSSSVTCWRSRYEAPVTPGKHRENVRLPAGQEVPHARALSGVRVCGVFSFYRLRRCAAGGDVSARSLGNKFRSLLWQKA